MELQGKPELTEAEKVEQCRLETEWSNHWLADRDDIPSPSSAASGAPVALLPERADVLLTACSEADKPAVLDHLRKVSDLRAQVLERMVDEVIKHPPTAIANLPVGAAQALVRALDAIGVDACIELTALSLRDDPQQRHPLAGINERAFLDIVDDERERLLNVLGSLRCIVQAVQSDAAPDEGEIAGAVDLIADQVQRVLDSLEEEPMLRTAREETAKVEEVQAASNRARAEAARESLS
jgi:hypothetical protein